MAVMSAGSGSGGGGGGETTGTIAERSPSTRQMMASHMTGFVDGRVMSPQTMPPATAAMADSTSANASHVPGTSRVPVWSTRDCPSAMYPTVNDRKTTTNIVA